MKAIKSFVSALLLCAVLASCSTQKSIEAAFVKNGYTMEVLAPAEQKQMAPILKYFPTLNLEAIGYLELDNSVTFIYNADEATWKYYGGMLRDSGFQDAGIGYVKSSRSEGVTYNISGNVTDLYGEPILLITYTYGKL